MNKYVFTFGLSQLQQFSINTTSLVVALIVEAESHSEARHIVCSSPIGTQFSTSYTYEAYLEQFKPWLNQMVNYTLDQLLSTYNIKPYQESEELYTFAIKDGLAKYEKYESEPENEELPNNRYIVRISEGDNHKETTIYAPNRETALQRATALLK